MRDQRPKHHVVDHVMFIYLRPASHWQILIFNKQVYAKINVNNRPNTFLEMTILVCDEEIVNI